MTALPLADLTDAEALALARIEAAEPAEESLTERLADALAAELESLGLTGEVSCHASEYLANAAIDVLRGPTDDAWIVAQLRALLREQDPDAVPIIARADLEAILDGDGGR